MTRVLDRRLRSTVLTGPEVVRMIVKNVTVNRKRGINGRVDLPTLPRLARRVVLEDQIIVIQDTTLKR